MRMLCSNQYLMTSRVCLPKTGSKRVADIQIGDILYDVDDHEVLCTGTADASQGPLYKISYKRFNSTIVDTITCTPDHDLLLVSSACVPSLSGTSVTWLSRCERHEPRHESGDLHLEAMADSFFHDLLDQLDEPVKRYSLHSLADNVLDEHFHEGHETYSTVIDC